MHHGLAGDGAERKLQPPGLRLAHQKFLEQHRMRADRFGVVVGPQRQQFVAQRQQAARLQPDDRHATRGKRRKACDQPVQLGARLIDKPGRKERAPAAQRPSVIHWPRDMDAITTLDQHAQRGVEIFPLIGAIESICEQHDFAAVFRSELPRVRLRTHRAGTRAGRAFALIPANCSNSLRSNGLLLRQIGDRRETRRKAGIARQIADQPVPQRKPVLCRPRRQHLDLHLRHVDAGRALVTAGLAGHAEF